MDAIISEEDFGSLLNGPWVAKQVFDASSQRSWTPFSSRAVAMAIPVVARTVQSMSRVSTELQAAV